MRIHLSPKGHKIEEGVAVEPSGAIAQFLFTTTGEVLGFVRESLWGGVLGRCGMNGIDLANEVRGERSYSLVSLPNIGLIDDLITRSVNLFSVERCGVIPINMIPSSLPRRGAKSEKKRARRRKARQRAQRRTSGCAWSIDFDLDCVSSALRRLYAFAPGGPKWWDLDGHMLRNSYPSRTEQALGDTSWFSGAQWNLPPPS